MNCEDCTRPIDGAHKELDGKFYHLSCAENLAGTNVLPGPKMYEVRVRYSGTITINVAAHNEEQAMAQAIRDAEMTVFDADDFDADNATILAEYPSLDMLEALENFIEAERKAAEKRAAALKAKQAAKPS